MSKITCHPTVSIFLIILVIIASLSGAHAEKGDSSVPLGATPSPVINPKSFPQSFEHEAEKAEIFQRYAENLILLPLKGASKQQTFLCQSLGDDLRTMNGITFVEPVISVENSNDARLRAYWPNCANLKPSFILWPPQYSTGEMQRKYYRTKSISLYRANILNRRNGSQDLVMYAQGLCTKDVDPVCTQPELEIVSQKTCSLKAIDIVEDSFVAGMRYGLTSIIMYKGLYWSISIEDQGNSSQFITASSRSTSDMNIVCLLSKVP